VASKIVSLILQAKNKLSPPVDDATKSLNKAKDRALELEKSLSQFEGAKKAIDSLDDVRDSAAEAEKSFDSAQLEVIRLKAALKTEKTRRRYHQVQQKKRGRLLRKPLKI
jgi:hypothetical protein